MRKPEQLRSIVEQLELEKKTAVSLTLFNDGIFGSETDLGTYGTEPRIDNSSNNRAWARQDELDWQETQMQRSFTGGEAVGMPDVINEVSPRSTANSLDSSLMIRELDQMHVSYLNSTYRQEQLNAWKNQSMTWNGETISVYDYIGRHLIYRFTVINIKQIKNKEEKIPVEENIPATELSSNRLVKEKNEKRIETEQSQKKNSKEDEEFIAKLNILINENMAGEELSIKFLTDKMAMSRASLYKR